MTRFRMTCWRTWGDFMAVWDENSRFFARLQKHHRRLDVLKSEAGYWLRLCQAYRETNDNDKADEAYAEFNRVGREIEQEIIRHHEEDGGAELRKDRRKMAGIS